MFQRSKLPVLSLALVAILAPASFADGFGISFTKSTKHGALSLGFNTGFCSPSCEPRCAPAVWVPGHYETVYRQVWVDEGHDRVWIPPAYEWRSFGCGRPVRVCVRGGHYQRVFRSGHYETQPVRVWVGGGWRS